MPLPHDLKFLEKPIHFFKFEVNTESMMRCILWTLLFLGLAHYYTPSIEPEIPYATEMSTQGLTPISSASSDPKWSRLDYKKLPENSLAWVAGSSIVIDMDEEKDAIYLPAQVSTDYTQFVSLKMARRMLDTYTMVKDTIAREPKAMVVVLNPFWDIQDNTSFYKTNLMNAGVIKWFNTDDAYLIPLLASPGNVLWGAAGHRHSLVSNSYDILKKQQSRFKKPQKNKVKNQDNEPNKITYTQSILFWMMNAPEKNIDFKKFDASAWQIEVMAQNSVSKSEWGEVLLRKMFESIKESNIPTLFYVAPIRADIKKTKAGKDYEAVIKKISDISNKYQSDTIRFTTIPDNIINTMDYIDYIHTKDSGKLPEFLTSNIKTITDKK